MNYPNAFWFVIGFIVGVFEGKEVTSARELAKRIVNATILERCTGDGDFEKFVTKIESLLNEVFQKARAEERKACEKIAFMHNCDSNCDVDIAGGGGCALSIATQIIRRGEA